MTRGLLKQAALSEKLNQTHVLWPVELAWELGGLYRHHLEELWEYENWKRVEHFFLDV